MECMQLNFTLLQNKFAELEATNSQLKTSNFELKAKNSQLEEINANLKRRKKHYKDFLKGSRAEFCNCCWNRCRCADDLESWDDDAPWLRLDKKAAEHMKNAMI